MMSPLRRHLALTLALFGGVVAGCGPAGAPVAEPVAETTVAAPNSAIDLALRRAAEFLQQRQSADGAWRSEVYAPFRAGDALTPIVLVALQALPRDEQPVESIERGLAYLQQFIGPDGNVQPPPAGISYPVYVSAAAILALGERQDNASVVAREAWLKYLRERQLTEQNGWQPEDPYYGGWSYSLELPRKPEDGTPLNPLAEPNLSATVFAIKALRAAGVEPTADEVQRAKQFVERLQNFAPDGVERDALPDELRDGGFFFLQADGLRNKAGIAGRDAHGRERFASYGSATADGVQTLLLCGEKSDSPRVTAACRWLEQNFSAEHQPGKFEVAAARDSVYFYYTQSMALPLDEHRGQLEAASIPIERWANELAVALIKRQQKDGSWVNADVEVREDDPLVATSLAMTALAACKRVVSGAQPEANR